MTFSECIFLYTHVTLFHKSIKTKCAHNETKYKTYRNKLKQILYKTEKEYYSDLISANKSNMKIHGPS